MKVNVTSVVGYSFEGADRVYRDALEAEKAQRRKLRMELISKTLGSGVYTSQFERLIDNTEVLKQLSEI